MFDSLMPKLSTIAPEGGAIYLRSLPRGSPGYPNGGIAYKIRTGVDFDDPNTVEPADATVSVLLQVLRAMRVPGVDEYSALSVMRFAPQQGVGLLLKRLHDGRYAVKVQSPCYFDDPDAVEPAHATVLQLVSWITAVTTRGA